MNDFQGECQCYISLEIIIIKLNAYKKYAEQQFLRISIISKVYEYGRTVMLTFQILSSHII